ncbi:hypothetical protein ACFPA8_15615 [Streptomyces ovatisporus]|uniref:Uncharacterized protein n=1 Tax=Streptomyces ovatisporus TaxID=1128682 RepID=A0ABV9AAD5_9ACTN
MRTQPDERESADGTADVTGVTAVTGGPGRADGRRVPGAAIAAKSAGRR